MIIKKIFSIVFLTFIFFSAYSPVDALTVYVEEPGGVVRVGDTVVVKVLLDTEREEINALEGTVSVAGVVNVDSVQTGGSIFTLWPVAPLVKDNQIFFVGGNQSSVFGGRLRVFMIALTPLQTGTVTFDVSQLIGYRPDGSGTLVTSSSNQRTTFFVEEKTQDTRNDLKDILVADITPPQPFTIEYSRDPSLYDGKVFLSFYTTDTESGIQKYEVIEEGQKYMVTDNVYVLKNQDLVGSVTVIATDTAGNTQSERITFGTGKSPLFKTFVIAVILVLIRLCMWWFRKKRDENI